MKKMVSFRKRRAFVVSDRNRAQESTPANLSAPGLRPRNLARETSLMTGSA